LKQNAAEGQTANGEMARPGFALEPSPARPIIGEFLEKVPFVRAISGSLILCARKG